MKVGVLAKGISQKKQIPMTNKLQKVVGILGTRVGMTQIQIQDGLREFYRLIYEGTEEQIEAWQEQNIGLTEQLVELTSPQYARAFQILGLEAACQRSRMTDSMQKPSEKVPQLNHPENLG